MILLTHSRKGVPRRYFANVIDYVLYFIFFFMYLYAFGGPNEQGGYSVTGWKALGMPLVWIIYFPVCECIWGQTIGKKILGLHVVSPQGDTPNFIEAFLRRIIDFLELSTAGIMSVITITSSGKRVGDMIAGTVVISTEAMCRFCSAEIELSTREVIKEVFVCPTCKQPN